MMPLMVATPTCQAPWLGEQQLEPQSVPRPAPRSWFSVLLWQSWEVVRRRRACSLAQRSLGLLSPSAPGAGLVGPSILFPSTHSSDRYGQGIPTPKYLVKVVLDTPLLSWGPAIGDTELAASASPCPLGYEPQPLLWSPVSVLHQQWRPAEDWRAFGVRILVAEVDKAICSSPLHGGEVVPPPPVPLHLPSSSPLALVCGVSFKTHVKDSVPSMVLWEVVETLRSGFWEMVSPWQ